MDDEIYYHIMTEVSDCLYDLRSSVDDMRRYINSLNIIWAEYSLDDIIECSINLEANLRALRDKLENG
jgi:hypothetical protein